MFVNPDKSLHNYNSFGLHAVAHEIVHIYKKKDIPDLISKGLNDYKILGGGSNILLTCDQNCTILKNEIKGIKVIDENENEVLVQVGAGESWHQLVMWSLSHQLGGLENLSLIPGSVGAAPMQNIGAYGVEQEKVFHSLTAIDMKTSAETIFYKDECKFGYRESIFKNEYKNQYFITHVSYKLSKKNHKLSLEYGAIQSVLSQKGIINPDVKAVSDAVIEIRKSKLPDPAIIGNAGSFFKNPVISQSHFEKLKIIYPDISFYPQIDDTVKIPAGWLIEKAGFKGIRKGNIGVHKDQALVLVNYGGGSGDDILQLAKEIQNKVEIMYEIKLHPEVNIW
ncbi:MAG: UDP-N-acetylmuramate dehydrogenase [Saprospiraceae bacterium]|nr:UDP-N-acetylmuramate dehydrogenase [Saprospiraceae bacterium]